MKKAHDGETRKGCTAEERRAVLSDMAGALALTRPTGDVALDVSGTAGALALTTVAWGVTRPTQ